MTKDHMQITLNKQATLAKNIKALMTAYAVNADQLAEKIEWDVRALNELLTGRTATPDVFLVADIAYYFELYIEDLLRRTISLDLVARRAINRSK